MLQHFARFGHFFRSVMWSIFLFFFIFFLFLFLFFSLLLDFIAITVVVEFLIKQFHCHFLKWLLFCKVNLAKKFLCTSCIARWSMRTLWPYYKRRASFARSARTSSWNKREPGCAGQFWQMESALSQHCDT